MSKVPIAATSKNRPFVKFYRDLFDSPLATDYELWKLYMLLLKRARYVSGVESKWCGKGNHDFMLNVGQCVVGRNELGAELGCSPSTARDRLKRLESLGFVGLESTAGYTKVTVEGLEASAVDAPSKSRALSATTSATLKPSLPNKNKAKSLPSADESANPPTPYRHPIIQPSATNKECKNVRREECDLSTTTTKDLVSNFSAIAHSMAKTLREKAVPIDQATWRIVLEATHVLLDNCGSERTLHEIEKSGTRPYLKPGYFVTIAKNFDPAEYDIKKLSAPDVPLDSDLIRTDRELEKKHRADEIRESTRIEAESVPTKPTESDIQSAIVKRLKRAFLESEFTEPELKLAERLKQAI